MSEEARARAGRERNARLRQRLWGALMLIAIAVIVLPFLLDGAGSESRFRHVERLREEPPRQRAPETPLTASRLEPDERAVNEVPEVIGGEVEPFRAWVVQAASFTIQSRALAVRDRLRDAGYPSFVTDASVAVAGDADGASSGASRRFRVQVGPMIDQERAAVVRTEVARLLGGEPIVLVYP